MEVVINKVVNFYGDDIQVVEVESLVNGKLERILGVVAKPFFEDVLGVPWKEQRIKIMEDFERYQPFLSKSTAEDGKQRDMVCIPYVKFNHLINSLNTKKLKDRMILSVINGKEVEESLLVKISRYQDECSIVLHDYWNKGFAMNFRAKPDQFDSEMSFNILESSQLRYHNAFQSLASTIVDQKGFRGADFEREVLSFTDELSELVLDCIKGILGAEELDLKTGRIRLSGDSARQISGTEACDITLLQSSFADLVSQFRRGEIGEGKRYETILDELPSYFDHFLANTQNRYVMLRSTYRQGKGLMG